MKKLPLIRLIVWGLLLFGLVVFFPRNPHFGFISLLLVLVAFLALVRVIIRNPSMQKVPSIALLIGLSRCSGSWKGSRSWASWWHFS
jgi:uncharacterized protein YhhL (DUF1145 family)